MRITDGIPGEYSSSKAHEKEGIGETFMEENTDFCATDTIPLPVLDVERKTIPLMCPRCDKLSGVAKTDVLCFNKISTASWLCRKCADFLNEGISRRNRSLRNLLFYFWR